MFLHSLYCWSFAHADGLHNSVVQDYTCTCALTALRSIEKPPASYVRVCGCWLCFMLWSARLHRWATICWNLLIVLGWFIWHTSGWVSTRATHTTNGNSLSPYTFVCVCWKPKYQPANIGCPLVAHHYVYTVNVQPLRRQASSLVYECNYHETNI